MAISSVSTSDTVRVAGLVQFARELRDIDPNLQKELKGANLSAAQIVAKLAAATATSQGGVAALAARSIRATAAQREGSVRIGGANRAGRVALGAEFGSLRWHQFKPWKGNGDDAGYFLWPSIRLSANDVAKQYEAAFDRVAFKAFPDGRAQGTQ